MTMASREPHQIIDFDVAFDKSPDHIQATVDSSPWTKRYGTDGYGGYVDIIYPREPIRNIRDKSDTFTAEGVNTDLRCYIPILARRNRWFTKKIAINISATILKHNSNNHFIK